MITHKPEDVLVGGTPGSENDNTVVISVLDVPVADFFCTLHCGIAYVRIFDPEGRCFTGGRTINA